MNANIPISFKELTTLAAVGINPNLCKLGVLSFESDKYISARDAQPNGDANLLICELEKNFAISSKSISKAEAAIMHPSKNIISLRAKNEKNATIIQIFNRDLGTKLKDIVLNYDIKFWKWLNEMNLALVTDTSVYTLSIETLDSPPKKIFDRSGPLANQSVFIMNISCDSNMQWFALSAISSSKDQSGAINVLGNIQIFCSTVGQNQHVEGFCANFGSVKAADDTLVNCLSFIEKKSTENKFSLLIHDISSTKKIKVNVDMQMLIPNDFPVLLNFVENAGCVFICTNFGNFYLYEITRGILIFRCKLNDDPCIFSAKNSKLAGYYYLTKGGKLLSVNIDVDNILPYMMTNLRNIDNIVEVCIHLAGKYNLPGAEKIFVGLFKNYIAQGNYLEAAKICRDSPGESLRNIETINVFQAAQGNPPPAMLYFQTVMEKGKFNKIESVEITKTLINSGKKNLIEEWFNQGKYTCSEELSELVKVVDQPLSLKILLAAGSPNAHAKIIEGLAQTGQTDKIMPYCQTNNFRPDWVTLLRNVIVTNSDAAVGIAKTVCNRVTNTYLIDINTIIEIFATRKKIQELTRFMVEYLKDNRAEDSFYQTKIIELNLYENIRAAQMLIESNVLTHYDKQKIGSLCEKMGLYQCALDNYTDINDIKRIIVNSHLINSTFLLDYLGRLIPENLLICLHELLRANPMQNFQIVVEGAVKYCQRIPLNELVKLFETYNSFNGLFLFINRIVNSVNDPEIMFKYISAGVIIGNFEEVQRVIKDYDSYDPKKVLEFFLEKKLPDPRPLVLLCDKHDYIEELTNYLYKNKLMRFIENYLFKLRTQATPRVCAALLDNDCDENYIKQLLNTVRAGCPIEPLVEEFTKRHKLKILQKFLEDREQEGNTTPALHNALIMIYIDNNNNPKDYLLNNKYYDSQVIGEYCEERDPHLAVIAYRRANGKCDDELIALTNKNAMYRAQAQYLVESCNPDLWKKVLDANNDHKKFVTDQVVSVILPVTRNPEEVKITVKAFIDAGLQADTLDLLEKIVLHNNEFQKNASLQTLLIMTAIAADPKKVKGYLTKLDSYKGDELAIRCIENSLFEEAFYIYDKSKDYVSAIDVIIRYMNDLKRATIFAEKINTPPVWSKIGRAKIDSGEIDEAIDAFIKANDPEMYNDVINCAEKQGKFEDLINYLTMVRQFKKDKYIDGELVYSLSKCGKLTDLEAFIASTNISDIGNIADRLYDERIYEASKILYEHVGNNLRLASCYVHLKQYQAALAAAKKANSPKCWKEVCFACVKAGEFRLASQAGTNIISMPDFVDELVKEYEKWGAYAELILLFEANMIQQRNHIVTELGILYAKYKEEKLMDHCINNYENMNIPKLIRVCEQNYHWNEVVFLHNHYNGYDSALNVMIEHSPLCWRHDLFCQTLQKVTNTNLYCEAIKFYVNEQPHHLNDMLKVISNKLDLSTCVYELKNLNCLPMALPFLKSVQSNNNFDVNEALNSIFVDEEDPDSLKNSILEYSSFDQINLAKRIENHELLEFRRISALVYRKNKKFVQSIEISKKLEFFKDAIETALESGNDKLCEELLRFFASIGDKECFCACLYTCYEFIKPDVAMELAWRYNFTEFLMPYMIQTVRDLTIRMDHMQRKAEEDTKQKQKEKEEMGGQSLDVNFGFSNALVPMGLPGMNMPGQGMGGMPGFGGMPNMNMNMGGMGNFGPNFN